MKVQARSENKITLYNNCIVDKGKMTLYFLVDLYNYSIYTNESISNEITSLYNFVLNVENSFSNLKFSLFRFRDIVSPEEYVKSFIQTIRLWSPNFQPSQEFIDNVQYTSQFYCFMAVNIDQNVAIDFNSMQIKDIIKQYGKMVVDAFASYKQQDIDTKAIEDASNKIEYQGQGIIKPCPENILLSYYIKRVYPYYEIILPPDQFDSTKAVLSHLQQNFTPHFNYFEMDNSGVEYFGVKAKTTYGSIIDIIEFPEEIISESFDMCHSGLVANVKCLSKQEAKLKFMRRKEDIAYEEESAISAGAKEINLELSDYRDLAETGIAAVSLGRKIVESDIHILLLSDDIDDLNKKRFNLISKLKNMNIIATFNADQANTYVNSFVKLRPTNYPFLMDLRYVFSFRLNSGSAVGDFSSKFTSPIIGQTVESSEAII